MLNNTHFFLKPVTEIKKIMMLGKVTKFSKQNGIRILYTKLQSDTLCYRQTKKYMQKIPSVTGIIQTYNMYVIGSILLSVLKTMKHTWLYPATYYCTRLQGVKERIAQGSVGIF